jgi:hypothetical protein
MPTLADPLPLAKLYEKDETAWLDRMAVLAEQHQAEEMDFDNLAEFLTSMASRDRKEVKSRITILLLHLLKWEFQPEKQSTSWKVTIRNQRRALSADLESGVLYNHAEEVLPLAYADAVEDAIDETGLPAATFPPACPWTLEQMLQM